MDARRKAKKNARQLEERLGVTFKDLDLLIEALTHRSFLNENRDFSKQNERLETLGDAVLELIVTEHVFKAFPDATEGEITKTRSSLVCNDALRLIAEYLQLEEHLLMSKGQRQGMHDDRQRGGILACAVEALLGAMYLDQGFGPCRSFIDFFLHTKLNAFVKRFSGSKELLQEFTQERFGITPTYQLLRKVGPKHAPLFTTGVYLDKLCLAKGTGRGRKSSEKEAAGKALKKADDWGRFFVPVSRDAKREARTFQQQSPSAENQRKGGIIKRRKHGENTDV